MKPRLDMDKIAKGLRGVRQGKVVAQAGYFGAMQLVANLGERLRVPVGGGRPTNPNWTERRLVPLTSATLKHLEELAEKIRADRGVSIEPMQIAAIFLEKLEGMSVDEAEQLVGSRKIPRQKRRGG